MNIVSPIIQATTGVIVKLQEQTQQFKPVVETAVVNGQIIPAKYKNEPGEFTLTEEEWSVVDQWAGVYEHVPHSIWENLIV